MKKVFQISTTYHMNAEDGQVYAVKEWLKSVCSEKARQYNQHDPSKYNGPTVTVIVEVLDN